MVLIYGIIFLLIFLSIGFGLFIWSRKRKSKFGLTVSIGMILLVVLALLNNTIDEYTISKKGIITDLRHLDIELKDKFEITSNKVTGMPERIQETEIEITKTDKDRIISDIKNSQNFQSFTNKHELAKELYKDQFETSNKIFNFKYPEFYSRETYTIIDHIPTRLYLYLDENTNKLKYNRIED